MFARFRLALARLIAPGFGALTPCERCAELKQDVAYWRGREERATEALLSQQAGVVGVAREVKQPANVVGQAMSALNQKSFRSQRNAPSSEPGQAAMSGRTN